MHYILPYSSPPSTPSRSQPLPNSSNFIFFFSLHPQSPQKQNKKHTKNSKKKYQNKMKQKDYPHPRGENTHRVGFVLAHCYWAWGLWLIYFIRESCFFIYQQVSVANKGIEPSVTSYCWDFVWFDLVQVSLTSYVHWSFCPVSCESSTTSGYSNLPVSSSTQIPEPLG